MYFQLFLPWPPYDSIKWTALIFSIIVKVLFISMYFFMSKVHKLALFVWYANVFFLCIWYIILMLIYYCRVSVLICISRLIYSDFYGCPLFLGFALYCLTRLLSSKLLLSWGWGTRGAQEWWVDRPRGNAWVVRGFWEGSGDRKTRERRGVVTALRTSL